MANQKSSFDHQKYVKVKGFTENCASKIGQELLFEVLKWGTKESSMRVETVMVFSGVSFLPQIPIG